MNSLNIISSRVSPSSSPVPSRSNSIGTIGLAVSSEDDGDQNGDSSALVASDEETLIAEPDEYSGEKLPAESASSPADETTPLLSRLDSKPPSDRLSSWHLIPKHIASTLASSIRWVLSTLAAPGVYLIACLYDENGAFAPFLQLRKAFGVKPSWRQQQQHKLSADDGGMVARDEKPGSRWGPSTAATSSSTASALGQYSGSSRSSSPSSLSSESESEPSRSKRGGRRGSTKQQHSRSKSLEAAQEIAPSRRSIRIKLSPDDSQRQSKHRKTKSAVSYEAGGAGNGSGNSGGNAGGSGSDISAQLKSPTSPVGALTRYPRTPAPPRPLIPRRQPSYINVEPLDRTPQKTLILDLDETLIHSMSKGGRMSTGHMVEVRLNTTYVGVSGQASVGPQHPILYYVHKRPHCDDFLRRVCKWFNLVVFTASVQEYADPVIDWLESERKFFSARYYRQHCTFRHGAFIKDLSSVEPDLSKAIILDNSPLSYMFHQDNAIPIQGWINDPTDNDLLHLVPLLEGLQYVSDVRALLALRGGEDGQHMA